VPWSNITAAAAACAPSCRLLLLVRHAQAASNAVAAAVATHDGVLALDEFTAFRAQRRAERAREFPGAPVAPAAPAAR
jgi:hypothetical protein